MVNKNKTIINNKNIIQICGATRKQQKQSSNYSPKINPSSTNVSVIPHSSTPIYNSFPNSTSLEDESRRIRFLHAMRDPVSTQSPYSIFDNGSNTFRREGNTEGYEPSPTQQINPDEYFDEPQRTQFTQPQFRSASLSSYSFIPRTQNRQVRIQASPSAFLETPNRNVSPITLGGTTRFNLDDDGELGGGFGKHDETTKSFATAYDTPFIGLSYEEIERDRKEAERLEQINRGRRAVEEAERIKQDKENTLMGNEDKREQAKLEEEQEEDEEDEEETESERQQRLKEEARKHWKKQDKEMKKKEKIRTAFSTLLEKIQSFIDAGNKEIKARSELKNEINVFINNPDYVSYTQYKSKKNDNLGNTRDPKRIKSFLETRLKKVVDDIEQIQESIVTGKQIGRAHV